MSDFTPSTEQVRDGYRFDPEAAFYDPIHEEAIAREAGRAFDRWLAQHDVDMRELVANQIEQFGKDAFVLDGDMKVLFTYRAAAKIIRGHVNVEMGGYTNE